MLLWCDMLPLQGVWGAACPGYPLGGGEREGRSPLASMQQCSNVPAARSASGGARIQITYGGKA
jgi:hypothetical protein